MIKYKQKIHKYIHVLHIYFVCLYIDMIIVYNTYTDTVNERGLVAMSLMVSRGASVRKVSRAPSPAWRLAAPRMRV